MIELSPNQFSQAAPLFAEIQHSTAIVCAVLEGNSPGRVFVDDPPRPTAALIYAEGAFLYAAGDENNPLVSQSLVPTIFESILPAASDPEMVLFAFTDAWRAKLDELLRERGAIRIRRKMFRFHPEIFAALPDWRSALPSGLTLRPIDARLAEQVPAYRQIIDPATKRFGVCLVQGDEIASECSAVFVGGGEAEIDVHTAEKYRRRGFARLAAAAFIEECLARGLTPNWACWPERQASIALAKSLGFSELPDVPAHYWTDKMDLSRPG